MHCSVLILYHWWVSQALCVLEGIFSPSLISLSASSSMDQSEYDASMDWSEYKEYKY